MDVPTVALVSTLRERDALRAAMAENDAALAVALRAWGKTRPGAVGGKTTEHGARYVLGQAGLL